MERAKHERAWKSPHARKASTRQGERKMRDYRKSPSFCTYALLSQRKILIGSSMEICQHFSKRASSSRETAERKKLVSGVSFTCNKLDIPRKPTNGKSNDSSMRKGNPLDALNWIERLYEVHTPKSVRLEPWTVTSLGFVCSPSFFSFRAASRLSRGGDFHARSHFARSTVAVRKWGLLVVYVQFRKDFWDCY